MTAPYQTALDWEAMFAPYDEQTYIAALDALNADDIVLDIGAGDLRFAKCAASRVKQVIAIEQRPELLSSNMPENLTVINADAREYLFPSDVTAAVLLMRHCRHFTLYREKLERIGCKKLITNARWRMGLEVIDLSVQSTEYASLHGGWYACRCGGVGFVEHVYANIETVTQVKNCPSCLNVGKRFME